MIFYSQADEAIADRRIATDAFKGLPFADYDRSGDLDSPLYTFPLGSHVNSAIFRLKGDAFSGRLKSFKGVSATESSVFLKEDGSKEEAPPEGEQAYVIDFGAARAIVWIYLETGIPILACPWVGNRWADEAILPDESGIISVQSEKRPVTAKLLVQVRDAGAVDFIENCHVVTNTYPSNLKASLNGRLPFWSHPGELSGEVQVTGLAEALNALLKDAQGESEVTLHLSTDAPGVLSAGFDPKDDLDFDLSDKARWGNSDTLDITLQALEDKEVLLTFPASGIDAWKVRRLALDVKEKFPLWTAHPGQMSTAPGRIGMKMNSRFSVARRLVFPEGGELYGFAVPFRSLAESAEIRAETVTEEKNQPSSKETLGNADLVLSLEAVAASGWTDLLFSSPMKIERNQAVWLVLKVKKGGVEWMGSVEPPTLDTATLFNDEGGQWQPYPLIRGNCPVAQVRVLRAPLANENGAFLGIAWNGKANEGAETVLDRSEDTVRVELALAQNGCQTIAPKDGVVPVAVVMRARSSGVVTIREATALRSSQ